jgi:predicted nucleic acid-binding protein
MVLLDTCVLIDCINENATEETQILDQLLLNKVPIVIGDLILMELLQGAKTEADARAILKSMSEFQVIQIGGATCAIQAAQYFRALRRMGITIRKTIDCLIATRCIIDELWLLTSDRDFTPFETHFGLQRASFLYP